LENNPYYTHRAVLKKILSIVDKNKPILELGCGDGSTGILHDFCVDNSLNLFTLDNNLQWIEQTKQKYPENKFHKYKKILDWNSELIEFTDKKWGLVFIDQSPWEARVTSLNLFKNISDFLIIHDCDYFPVNNIFGKQISPLVSQDNTGKRDYSDVFNNYLEYFPKNFACYNGPPTLLGSQFFEINFSID